MADKYNSSQDRQFEEKVVQVSRVSKKTKGGNKMGFAVLMVVGDGKGKVGVGLGKASDVLSAIRKGVRKARKKMFEVPMDGTTIPFQVNVKRGAAKILLNPAPRGSGVIAGGPVRAVVEAAGIRDISAKILGTDNKASNVYATFEALQHIRHIVTVNNISLKSVAEEEREEAEKERELQREAKQKASDDADEKDSKDKKKTADEKAKKSEAKKPAQKAAPKKPAAKKTEKKVEEKTVETKKDDEKAPAKTTADSKADKKAAKAKKSEEKSDKK